MPGANHKYHRNMKNVFNYMDSESDSEYPLSDREDYHQENNYETPQSDTDSALSNEDVDEYELVGVADVETETPYGTP